VELPDSAYLILTLDFLNAGTLSFDEVPLRGSGRRSTIQHAVTSVDVIGCDLVWRRTTHYYYPDMQRGASRTVHEFVVPLKAIDTATVEVRSAFGRSGTRLDPRPFEIIGFSRDRSQRPFTITNVERHITRGAHMFGLTVRDADSAERLARVLLDAARRCDTWITRPRSRSW
jgi:hypothetical protein